MAKEEIPRFDHQALELTSSFGARTDESDSNSLNLSSSSTGSQSINSSRSLNDNSIGLQQNSNDKPGANTMNIDSEGSPIPSSQAQQQDIELEILSDISDVSKDLDNKLPSYEREKVYRQAKRAKKQEKLARRANSISVQSQAQSQQGLSDGTDLREIQDSIISNYYSDTSQNWSYQSRGNTPTAAAAAVAANLIKRSNSKSKSQQYLRRSSSRELKNPLDVMSMNENQISTQQQQGVAPPFSGKSLSRIRSMSGSGSSATFHSPGALALSYHNKNQNLNQSKSQYSGKQYQIQNQGHHGPGNKFKSSSQSKTGKRQFTSQLSGISGLDNDENKYRVAVLTESSDSRQLNVSGNGNLLSRGVKEISDNPQQTTEATETGINKLGPATENNISNDYVVQRDLRTGRGQVKKGGTSPLSNTSDSKGTVDNQNTQQQLQTTTMSMAMAISNKKLNGPGPEMNLQIQEGGSENNNQKQDKFNDITNTKKENLQADGGAEVNINKISSSKNSLLNLTIDIESPSDSMSMKFKDRNGINVKRKETESEGEFDFRSDDYFSQFDEGTRLRENFKPNTQQHLRDAENVGGCNPNSTLSVLSLTRDVKQDQINNKNLNINNNFNGQSQKDQKHNIKILSPRDLSLLSPATRLSSIQEYVDTITSDFIVSPASQTQGQDFDQNHNIIKRSNSLGSRDSYNSEDDDDDLDLENFENDKSFDDYSTPNNLNLRFKQARYDLARSGSGQLSNSETSESQGPGLSNRNFSLPNTNGNWKILNQKNQNLRHSNLNRNSNRVASSDIKDKTQNNSHKSNVTAPDMNLFNNHLSNKNQQILSYSKPSTTTNLSSTSNLVSASSPGQQSDDSKSPNDINDLSMSLNIITPPKSQSYSQSQTFKTANSMTQSRSYKFNPMDPHKPTKADLRRGNLGGMDEDSSASSSESGSGSDDRNSNSDEVRRKQELKQQQNRLSKSQLRQAQVKSQSGSGLSKVSSFPSIASIGKELQNLKDSSGKKSHHQHNYQYQRQNIKQSQSQSQNQHHDHHGSKSGNSSFKIREMRLSHNVDKRSESFSRADSGQYSEQDSVLKEIKSAEDRTIKKNNFHSRLANLANFGRTTHIKELDSKALGVTMNEDQHVRISHVGAAHHSQNGHSSSHHHHHHHRDYHQHRDHHHRNHHSQRSSTSYSRSQHSKSDHSMSPSHHHHDRFGTSSRSYNQEKSQSINQNYQYQQNSDHHQRRSNSPLLKGRISQSGKLLSLVRAPPHILSDHDDDINSDPQSITNRADRDLKTTNSTNQNRGDKESNQQNYIVSSSGKNVTVPSNNTVGMTQTSQTQNQHLVQPASGNTQNHTVSSYNPMSILQHSMHDLTSHLHLPHSSSNLTSSLHLPKSVNVPTPHIHLPSVPNLHIPHPDLHLRDLHLKEHLPQNMNIPIPHVHVEFHPMSSLSLKSLSSSNLQNLGSGGNNSNNQQQGPGSARGQGSSTQAQGGQQNSTNQSGLGSGNTSGNELRKNVNQNDRSSVNAATNGANYDQNNQYATDPNLTNDPNSRKTSRYNSTRPSISTVISSDPNTNYQDHKDEQSRILGLNQIQKNLQSQTHSQSSMPSTDLSTSDGQNIQNSNQEQAKGQNVTSIKNTKSRRNSQTIGDDKNVESGGQKQKNGKYKSNKQSGNNKNNQKYLSIDSISPSINNKKKKKVKVNSSTASQSITNKDAATSLQDSMSNTMKISQSSPNFSNTVNNKNDSEFQSDQKNVNDYHNDPILRQNTDIGRQNQNQNQTKPKSTGSQYAATGQSQLGRSENGNQRQNQNKTSNNNMNKTQSQNQIHSQTVSLTQYQQPTTTAASDIVINFGNRNGGSKDSNNSNATATDNNLMVMHSADGADVILNLASDPLAQQMNPSGKALRRQSTLIAGGAVHHGQGMALESQSKSELSNQQPESQSIQNHVAVNAMIDSGHHNGMDQIQGLSLTQQKMQRNQAQQDHIFQNQQNLNQIQKQLNALNRAATSATASSTSGNGNHYNANQIQNQSQTQNQTLQTQNQHAQMLAYLDQCSMQFSNEGYCMIGNDRNDDWNLNLKTK